MNKNLRLLIIPFILFGFYASGQTITKETTSIVAGTVCPTSQTDYKVSIPGNFGTCKIKWTVTNGTISGADNQQNVSVIWSDIPGATGIVTVTFSGCETGNPNEGASTPKSELILSVKNQSMGNYDPSVDIDWCTQA